MPTSSQVSVPLSRPLDEQHGATFPALVAIMQRLLAEDGCPWDREQTLESLRPFVLEEACEVIDAIDAGDPPSLCDELGDLTLQVVFVAELARRAGHFGPDDVVRAIAEKLVRRHPHVFGTVQVSGSDEVIENWNAIKRTEKLGRPLLDGIPRSLPALMRATRVSETVGRIGFDWPDPAGSRAKVTEELAELDEALEGGDARHIEHELGDLLFATVNLARHAGVDPERALRRTADRFCERFSVVERRVREQHGDWPRDGKGKPGPGIELHELDGYWEEAKQLEREGRGAAR